MLHRKQYRVAVRVTIMVLALTLTACGTQENTGITESVKSTETVESIETMESTETIENVEIYRSYGFRECGTTGNGKCHTTDATGGIHQLAADHPGFHMGLCRSF